MKGSKFPKGVPRVCVMSISSQNSLVWEVGVRNGMRGGQLSEDMKKILKRRGAERFFKLQGRIYSAGLFGDWIVVIVA